MDETRQSPEQFLKEIEKEKQNLNRGHLKIFFGYAAGVGKTYAMLKACLLYTSITKIFTKTFEKIFSACQTKGSFMGHLF